MISERALKTLEYDKILERLQDHASFSLGKELAAALRPATRRREVEARLSQTAEARTLLESKPATHLGGAHDLRAAARRAEVGAILTPTELMDIGTTLGASARFRGAALKGDIDAPWLRDQAERMVENRPLIDALEQTFTERGEILDSASPALRRIRQEMKTAQGRILDRLNGMVASADYRTALQEPIVTMRNGRYVVPVRHESRTKIPGIVHDQSSSGQTIFVEPLAVTELNNRVKELELAEQREIERILQALSQRVAAQGPELRTTVEALGDVDVAFAKAKYAAALRAQRPDVGDDGQLRLVAARHPLLTGEVVPITIWLGETFRLLVITGPNTGGKTVALKTVGLLTLMAQAGLHIPVGAGSKVAVFEKVFADIGDEQSIEQSLSTFSSHLRNIVEMLPQIDGQSLALLDELGAGTDPAEGAALARAILAALLRSGARGVITTHYSELKSFAHEVDGVENAHVEFDVQTLSPTYRLVIGLPGRSQALAIARRLGMPKEIIAEARRHVASGAVRVEKLLSQIQNERTEIGRLYQRARELHEDAEKLRDRVQNELREVQRERTDILSAARDEASSVVRDLRRRLRELEHAAPGRVSRREHKDVLAQIEAAQQEAVARIGPPSAGSEAEAETLQPVHAGATVSVLSLGQQGTVVSLAGGEAEVQIGQFKLRVPIDDLEVLSKRQAEAERAVRVQSARPAPPTEIDLRGWRADEVIPEIDQYLHDNYMHGQNTIRILHGKGTGALRKVIREQLASHPLVKSFEAERPELGGEGVTIVKLTG